MQIAQRSTLSSSYPSSSKETNFHRYPTSLKVLTSKDFLDVVLSIFEHQKTSHKVSLETRSQTETKRNLYRLLTSSVLFPEPNIPQVQLSTSLKTRQREFNNKTSPLQSHQHPQTSLNHLRFSQLIYSGLFISCYRRTQENPLRRKRLSGLTDSFLTLLAALLCALSGIGRRKRLIQISC